jgi:ubiquinone/menaquinone biosynthesis C-methylase UbiE
VNPLDILGDSPQSDSFPRTIADRTRRVYDRLSVIYPASTFFFHSKAHQCVLDMAGIRDGMKVLEVATGSGEMFRRLVKANPQGHTVGVDLSPNMAAKTQRIVRKAFPGVSATCQAVDARYLPFKDESFDSVVCCYLLELLGSDDIVSTLGEIQRVLRTKGTFALVLIGQNTELFNMAYRVAGSVAPAFWGRQVEEGVPSLIRSLDFRITGDRTLRQGFYPSRVLTARK